MLCVNILGITVFLVTLQFLHILRYNFTVAMLSTALTRSATNIMVMGGSAFLILAAFTAFGYIRFGSFLYNYSTFKTSMITLCAGFLGQFYFSELEITAGLFGKMFLLLYLLTMIYFVVNFFITMLSYFLEAVKSDKSVIPADHEVVLYLLESLKGLIIPQKEHEEGDENTPEDAKL